MQGELDDPFTYAQIRFLLFLYALLWRNTNVASRLLKSVFSIVERNDIRFVHEYKLFQVRSAHQTFPGLTGGLGRGGLPAPEFSESDYERVVFLASLIGADAGLQLFGLKREAEVSWLDLERQFFDELPVRLSTFETCTGSNVMRLTSSDPGRIPHPGTDASRVEESRIAALKPRDQFTEAAQGRKCVISPRIITPRPLIIGFSTTEDVIQSCKDLISSHFFAIEGLPTFIAAHEDDHEGHLILRCAAIVVHTAMAILLRTLSEALAASQDNPTAPAENQDLSLVYRRRCRKSLKEAIKITRGLADPDFPFIDVAMAVRVCHGHYPHH